MTYSESKRVCFPLPPWHHLLFLWSLGMRQNHQKTTPTLQSFVFCDIYERKQATASFCRVVFLLVWFRKCCQGVHLHRTEIMAFYSERIFWVVMILPGIKWCVSLWRCYLLLFWQDLLLFTSQEAFSFNF